MDEVLNSELESNRKNGQDFTLCFFSSSRLKPNLEKDTGNKLKRWIEQCF